MIFLKSQKRMLVTVIAVMVSMGVVAQKKPDIKGNKSVATLTKELDYFNAIQLEENIEFTLVKGDTPLVTFVADDNLPPVFKFSVLDSILHISTYYEIKSKKTLNIQIQYPNLEKVKMSNGRVNLSFVNDPDASVDIVLNQNALIEVSGVAHSLSVKNSDRSYISVSASLSELEVKSFDRATYSVKGAVTHLNARLADHSSILLEGTAEQSEFVANGTSRIEGGNWRSKNTSIILSGNANAAINTEEVLKISLAEQAELQVYGSPKLQVESFTGTAKIEKKELKK